MACLTSLIFYSKKKASEREMWIRRIIHFVVLEVVLLIFAKVTGRVNDIVDMVILVTQIAVIYVICRYLSWMNDKKAANRINEKLDKMREALRVAQEEE
jgi:Ca2+/Na+ antiporter